MNSKEFLIKNYINKWVDFNPGVIRGKITKIQELKNGLQLTIFSTEDQKFTIFVEPEVETMLFLLEPQPKEPQPKQWECEWCNQMFDECYDRCPCC